MFPERATKDSSKKDFIKGPHNLRLPQGDAQKSLPGTWSSLQALEASEIRYRRLFETAQDGILILDAETGRIVDVNPYMVDMLHYTHEEFLGKELWKVSPFKDTVVNQAAFEELQKKGYIRYKDLPLQTKEGKPVAVEFVSNVYRSNGNKVIQCNIRNITERKEAEVSLLESEERYKALFDRSLDLVYIYDFEGRFIDANDAALNRLGYEREEIRSMNFASLLSKDQLPLALKASQEIRETGVQTHLMEFRLRHKNGSEVYVETQGSIVMANGMPVAIQAIARDITERRRAGEESKQSFAMMRKALSATVHAISTVVEMKDPYTSGHQRRVADLSRSIAGEMGLSADRQDFIHTSTTIHDIGKIAIPSEILSKPTKLTDLEFSLIKTHARFGYDILKDIEFPWPVADVVLQHHERMNGSGYPQGLKGKDILLEARILAVSDVVESMASHRPYRPALGIETALEEIRKNKGILYDACVADACMKLFQEKGYRIR